MHWPADRLLAPLRLLPVLALVGLSLTHGPVVPAQVRAVVLQDPANSQPLDTPPLFPPRRAELTRLWEVGSEGTIIDGMIAGPGGVVYAAAEGVIRMLSPEDGRTIWERSFGERLSLSPGGRSGRIFQPLETRLVALSPQDGRFLWEAPLPAPALHAATATASLLIVPMEPRLIGAFATDSGLLLWSRELECEPSAPVGSGPEILVVGCEDGQFVGLDARQGDVLWTADTGNRIQARPLAVGKSAYLGNDAGEILAVGLKRGKRRYRSRVAADPVAPLTVHDELLLVGAMDNLLYAFRLRKGHLAWSADAGARNLSPPALRGNVAVCASPLAPWMVVMDVRDGQVLAREKFPGEERLSAAAPVFAGGVLVSATRTTAGGPGWITGYGILVEEVARSAGGPAPAASGSAVTPGS
jgi:outer membrane protein assembly factor BamB